MTAFEFTQVIFIDEKGRETGAWLLPPGDAARKILVALLKDQRLNIKDRDELELSLAANE